jgi:hypothetical protein
MLLNRVLAIALLAFSPAVFADALDINLNNSAAQFKFSSSASDLIGANGDLTGGLLYNDKQSLFLEAGLMVKGGGEDNAPGVGVAVGAKGVLGTVSSSAATNYKSINGSAIAVGGEISVVFPTSSRVAIVGEYFAAPKITSFSDASRFNQFGARFEVDVSPQARVYLGYREIGFGVDTIGSVTVDKGTSIGVIILF